MPSPPKPVLIAKPVPPKHACGVPPSSYSPNAGGRGAKSALMSAQAFPFTSTKFTGDAKLIIKYGFMQGLFYTRDKENAVENTIRSDKVNNRFDTWEDSANIKFERESSLERTDIRIAFEPGSSWSAVGVAALDIATDKPTLNLGWLSGNAEPTDADRGIILHEFGHALGLLHEHQSPARGQHIHLDEYEVYNYYTPLLGSRALVKSQIIDTYNKGTVLNMTKFDITSIMMYFMPAHLNLERIDIPVNTKLSKLDKALIMLNYPPNLKPLERPSPKEQKAYAIKLRNFIDAMIQVGVTNKAAGKILDEFTVNGSTAHACYAGAREKFTEDNEATMTLRSSNLTLQNAINSADLKQFGVMDFLGGVVDNKLFQSIVKNVINNTLVQRGVQLTDSIPAASPQTVARVMAGLSAHPQVGASVKEYANYFQGKGDEGQQNGKGAGQNSMSQAQGVMSA